MRIIRLGRDQQNDIVLEHPAVSGFHADIYVYDNGAIQYMDHSTNGSMIDDVFIQNSSCALSGNEYITLPGNIRIHIQSVLAQDVNSDTSKMEIELSQGQSYSQQSVYYENQNSQYAAPQNEESSEEITFAGIWKRLINHYADFKGRARRKEYWFFVLWNVIISTACNLLSLGLALIHPSLSIIGMILIIVYNLFVFVPGLALVIRRVHDINHHWSYILFQLIPFVGWVWLFIVIFKNSYPGDNQWGPCPKK